MYRLTLEPDIASMLGVKYYSVSVSFDDYSTRMFNEFVRLVLNNKEVLANMIRQAFEEMLSRGTMSDKLYWIPDLIEMHNGPCATCMAMADKYKYGGGDPTELQNIMNSPEHQAIHANSRVKRPVCYCQLLPYEMANNPLFAFQVYQNGLSSATDPSAEEVQELLNRVITEWVISKWRETEQSVSSTANSGVKV